jgi:hypothetical protein
MDFYVLREYPQTEREFFRRKDSTTKKPQSGFFGMEAAAPNPSKTVC